MFILLLRPALVPYLIKLLAKFFEFFCLTIVDSCFLFFSLFEIFDVFGFTFK